MNKKWTATAILKKYDRLWNLQANWRSLWQDVADYVIPKRSNILSQQSPGTKQTTRLFDSTAIHANELLAASMKQAITPADVRWFSLRVRNEDLMKNENVKHWLEDCSDKMFLAFRQSNFDSEVHELDLDLGGFGMGAMYVEETIPFIGLRFHTVAVGDYVIEENSDGMVDCLIRKFRLTARAAFDKWGSEVGEKVIKALEKNPEQYFPFLHMVSSIVPGVFRGYYVNMEDKKFVESPRIYREFPYMVPRWGKTAGEEYGRGPGFIAMPDIKTLNKAVQLELSALSKMINPPIKVSDNGVIGEAKMHPGGITTVQRNATFEAMQFNVDFRTTQVKAQELRASIRRIFFSDQLQLQEGPQMTAAEAYIRYELMQRILGPTVGRIQKELLNPLIVRVFWIMQRAGFFLPMPDELVEYRHQIDIEYEGTMAKAQRSQEMSGLQDLLNILTIVMQLDQSAVDWINIDNLITWIAEQRGVPTKLIRKIKEVEKLRVGRAQQAQVTQQQQQSLLVAEIVKKLTNALKAGVISKETLVGITGGGAVAPEEGEQAAV